MSLIRYQPVELFDHFNEDISRHFGKMRSRPGARSRDWTPAVDIREREDCYLISADVPGVERDNIDVTLENGVLTLKGERTGETGSDDSQYRRRERLPGSFTRKFTLPDTVDTKNISATVKNGVLDVRIPKQAKPRPTRITIN